MLNCRCAFNPCSTYSWVIRHLVDNPVCGVTADNCRIILGLEGFCISSTFLSILARSLSCPHELSLHNFPVFHWMKLNKQPFLLLGACVTQREQRTKISRGSVTEGHFSALSHSLFISGAGFKETEEYLTSDPFRQEVTDTVLTVQRCVAPEVEIPVIKCVWMR